MDQGEFRLAKFVDLHSNRIIRQTTGPHALAPSSLDSRRRDAVLKNRQRRPDKIVNSTCYQRNIGINLSSVFSLLVPFDFFLSSTFYTMYTRTAIYIQSTCYYSTIKFIAFSNKVKKRHFISKLYGVSRRDL